MKILMRCILLCFIVLACQVKENNERKNLDIQPPTTDTLAVFQWPKESFIRDPEKDFSPEDRAFHTNQMVHFYDVPGEFGYILEGGRYGFENVSVILTETHPGGGPPLHTHSVEEAHILQNGEYTVMIGDSIRKLKAPVVVRIPPNTPHAFYNHSDKIINLIGILPEPAVSYQELGPNPLIVQEQ